MRSMVAATAAARAAFTSDAFMVFLLIQISEA
jgi:hypothetical protein